MNEHNGSPGDPPDGETSQAHTGAAGSSRAGRGLQGSQPLAIRRRWQAFAAPTLAAVCASVLFCGVVTPDNMGRFGVLATSSSDTPGDLLAEFLARESRSRVAVGRDGTLRIRHARGMDDRSNDADTATWIATSHATPHVSAATQYREQYREPVDVASAADTPREPRPGIDPAHAPAVDTLVEELPVIKAGITLGRTAHVSIVPPFVVLSRGAESVMLSLESGSHVVPEHALPSWASQPDRDGHVVADFGWHGSVEVHADSIDVRRRSLNWHLPGNVI